MKVEIGSLRKEIWGGTLFVTLGLISITLILLYGNIREDADEFLYVTIPLCILIFFVDPWLRRYLGPRGGLVMVEVYIFMLHFALIYFFPAFLGDPEAASTDPRQMGLFLLYLIPIFAAGFSYGIRGSMLTCVSMFGLYVLSWYVEQEGPAEWNKVLMLLPIFILLFLLALMVGLMSEVKTRSERRMFDQISKVSTLNQIRELLKDSIYYENLWNHMLSLATHVIPSEIGLSISFGDSERGVRRKVKSAVGVKKIILEALVMEDGRSLLDHLKEEGEAVLWQRVNRIPHLRRDQKMKHIHSLLAAPLREGDRITGALILANPVDNAYYATTERDLLTVFMNQVQYALENAKLYREAAVTAQHLRFILRSISSGVISCDLDGRITAVNEATLEILRYDRDDLVGRKLGKHVYLFRAEDLILKTLREGTLYSSEEVTMATKDHEELQVGISTWKLHDDAGQDIGVIGVFKDVSEIKKMREVLDRKEKQAGLVALAAGMAHELRNPLGGVEGFASLLKRDLLDRPRSVEIINKMIDGIQSANQVLEQFLFLTEERPRQYQPIDAGKFIADMKLAVEAEARGKDIAWETAVRPAAYVFKADPVALRQVMQILLRNAVEASVTKGKINVTIEHTEMDNEVAISVVDTGVGIPGDHLDKVFNPFFTTKEKGTGLGLTVAAQHVQVMGGRITAESEIGKGSAIRIYLPA